MFNKLRNAVHPQRRNAARTIDNTLNLEPPVVIEDQWTLEPPNAPSREETEAFVKSYSFWYYRVYLGNGVYTLSPTLAVVAGTQW